MKVSFKFMSKYKSLSHMHLILWISGIESPVLKRIIEVPSLITNSSQNVYVICTMLQFQAVSIISPYDFHIFTQSINICFVHFVHIPLRSWKWQKSVKFIKIKAPREVWGLGINKKLAGGQDLPNYSID